jgi:hypothetical protein
MGIAASGTLGGGTVRRLAVALLAVVVVAGMVVPAARAAAGGQPVGVIVQARPGAVVAAARQVQDLGGRVGRQLGVISGFTALVPAGQVDRVRR